MWVAEHHSDVSIWVCLLHREHLPSIFGAEVALHFEEDAVGKPEVWSVDMLDGVTQSGLFILPVQSLIRENRRDSSL